MQVGDVVEPVEGAVVDVGLVLGLGGDRLVGEQIEVDVGPQLTDPLGAFHPVVGLVCHRFVAIGAQQRGHQRHPVAGPQRQVVTDDRRLNLAIQRHRGDGIFDAGHHEQLELHLVGRIAQPPQALGQAVRSRRRGVVGEQHGVELLLFGLRYQLLLRQ